jgi:hypothetical protein
MFHKLPTPVLLHCWKHHLSFICSEIDSYKKAQLFDIDSFNKILLTIGNSQMDLYTGTLSPEKIGTETIEILHLNNLLAKEKYEHWLAQHKYYQQITLSDQSNWTLRLGNQEDRHVHAHPSRYSPHSLRIDANTLKTIIVYLFEYEQNNAAMELEKVNIVRQKYLQLSPIKSVSIEKGIGAIWAKCVELWH